jgi:hypothetical protein
MSMLQYCGADTPKQITADQSRLDQTTQRDKTEAAVNLSHKYSTNRAKATTKLEAFDFIPQVK